MVDSNVKTITGASRLGAKAPRVLRRTAELIPDQLTFAAIRKATPIGGSAPHSAPEVCPGQGNAGHGACRGRGRGGTPDVGVSHICSESFASELISEEFVNPCPVFPIVIGTPVLGAAGPTPAACVGLGRTDREVGEGGRRCLDGAGGGQRALRAADPQQPGNSGTGYHRPPGPDPRARNRHPLQRRVAFGSKEIQIPQVQDEREAATDMRNRVVGHSVGVRGVDRAVRADNSYRRGRPVACQPDGMRVSLATCHRDAWRPRGGRSGGDTRKSHGDPDVLTMTGAWGSELTLLEFRSGQLNSSRTSCNSQPMMTLHPIDSPDRSL